MQIGMIGPGRMSANRVRRLLQGVQTCVLFNQSHGSVEDPAKAGADCASSLVDLLRKLEKPRAILMMIPGAFVAQRIVDLLPHLKPGDILLDSGDSYYADDIRRAGELAARDVHHIPYLPVSKGECCHAATNVPRL